MPRPVSKTELLHLSQKTYQQLVDYLAQLPDVQLEFAPGTMNRRVRDVLAHLHHWHLLFFEWYKVGMAGKKPDIPAAGYTWKTTPELNLAIWEKYRHTDLTEVRQLLHKSHHQIQQIIAQHTQEELFTKKLYPWTGTTSLGAYLISSTSSHYEWALKLIKKGLK